MTCGSRVWWSNTSVASTILSSSSSNSARAQRDGSVCSSTTWCPGQRKRDWPKRYAGAPVARTRLVVGHPFVDIWQAVKPARLGLSEWPVVPRGTDWKHGICQALGWPHAGPADVAAAWRRIRSRVRDWADLDAALIGRVEELIDFVTQP
jgi:hypothetical protein